MNYFLRLMEKLTGRRVESPPMRALTPRNTSSDELQMLAEWTKESIIGEIKFGPPGEKLNIITTGDLDPKGKLYPDYLKRREDRKKSST